MARENGSRQTAWTVLDASRSAIKQLDRFYFVESCACNDDFDSARNDGKKNIYLAVQDANMKLSIRSINVIDELQRTDEFVMDVKLKDGTEKLTSFGSRLTAAGIFWLCLFNCNTVVGVHLYTKRVVYEIRGIPCPNSISLSPHNPDMLYVAGGTGWHHNLKGKQHNELTAVLPTIGCVYEINTKTNTVKRLDCGSLGALAGIQVMQGQMYLSQLVNVVSASLYSVNGANGNDNGNTSQVFTTVWKGTETSNSKLCYFGDTLSLWDSQHLVLAVDRTIDARYVPAIQHQLLCSAAWCVAKLYTSVVNYFTGAPNALSNAELLMQFSTRDKFADIHFVLQHTGDNNSGEDGNTSAIDTGARHWHFKLDKSTLSGKLPEGCEFDGHVTHVQRHGGKVVFVNFKSPCVLLLDEAVVLEAMETKGSEVK